MLSHEGPGSVSPANCWQKQSEQVRASVATSVSVATSGAQVSGAPTSGVRVSGSMPVSVSVRKVDALQPLRLPTKAIV